MRKSTPALTPDPMINPVVPPEILSSIIDLLAHSGPLKDIRKLSTTCSFFRDQCRKHLFATIRIEENEILEVGESTGSPSIAQFTTLISEHPAVAPYIRNLTLVGPMDGGDDQGKLPETFTNLINLSTLEIQLYSDFWSEPLSDCVQTLSQRSSFRRLILKDVAQFPFNLLVTLSYLQDLELIGVEIIEEGPFEDATPPVCLKSLIMTTFEDFEDGQTGTALELRKSTGEFYIDLSGLESLTFLTINQDSVDHITRLLRSHGVKSLQKLSVGISSFDEDDGQPFAYSHVLRSWVLPHQNTLTILEFHFRILDQDDPYLGLCQALNQIALDNKLTTLKIVVELVRPMTSMFDDQIVIGEQWRVLCDVLAKPGWDLLTSVSLRVLIMNSPRRQEFSKLLDYFEPLSSKPFDFQLKLGTSSEDDPDSNLSQMVSELSAIVTSAQILPFVF